MYLFWGKVETVRDGYFYTNALCISLGIVIFSGLKRRQLIFRVYQILPGGYRNNNRDNYIHIYIHIQLLLTGKKSKLRFCN